MKDRLIKNKKIILIAFFSIIFLLIRDVFIYEVTSYDNWAYDVFVDNLRSNNMTLFMMIVTSFGSAFTLIGIILLFFLLSKNKKNGFYLSINIVLIFLINIIVKLIVQRPRPFGYNLIIDEYGYSFPSGHAMVSTAFYGFIMYLIYKNIKNKKLKWFLISSIFLLIILIMISRIYLGVHYLSDTLAGFSLAIVYLMVFITYIDNNKLLERK